MIKKVLAILSFITILFGVTQILPAQSPVFADKTPTHPTQEPRNFGECETFLGMTNWDCGVPEIHSEGDLKTSIPLIALNVANDLSILVAYLIIGYVIYAGYLYMFSGGDTNKAATGKKALVHAFTGLAIAMSANLIMNSIRIAMVGAKPLADCENHICVDPDSLVIGVINWVIGIAGFVSVAFLIYGGVLYITASGDPNKAKKARDVIKYSLIGLAIVALVTTITAVVSSAIRNANETSFINQYLISKEDNEKNI